jgi:hypothetical protein
VLAWADEFDKAHPAAEHEHEAGEVEDAEEEEEAEAEAQFAYATPRETLIPGRPGMAGAFHFMLNAFGHLQNVGLGGYTISNAGEGSSAGRALPLLTDDWVMGYWRDSQGWVEALLMINFEPFTVGKGGYPELGQSGEGLVDAQHSHQLIHQAMVAFHPFATADYDLSLFAGQGSATIGPPIFMHRASYGGSTPPRKHHKGENPHETFPVLGVSARWRSLWLEGSAFGARELTPDDSRFYPHPAAPKSFAARIRYDLGDWGEAQVSGERLRDAGDDHPDAWQGSASLYAKATVNDWPIDGLLDYGIDVPDNESSTHAALAEAAVRDPSYRNVFWARSEVNQREEPELFGGGHGTWFFQTVGAEHVFAACPCAGMQLGFFAEATYARIPNRLESFYGRGEAITLNVGLHLFGMWMIH